MSDRSVTSDSLPAIKSGTPLMTVSSCPLSSPAAKVNERNSPTVIIPRATAAPPATRMMSPTRPVIVRCTCRCTAKLIAMRCPVPRRCSTVECWRAISSRSYALARVSSMCWSTNRTPLLNCSKARWKACTSRLTIHAETRVAIQTSGTAAAVRSTSCQSR